MFVEYRASRAQALELRDHVRAREPYRLRDLARLIHATGGPIEDLDASFASLVPLWEWLVEFVVAGCPGVDPEVVPSTWRDAWNEARTEAGRRQEALRRPAIVVGEAIDHYARLAWDRYDSPAVWDIYVSHTGDRAGEDLHHMTGVVRSTGWRPCHFGAWWAGAVVADLHSARTPETLLRIILRQEGWSEPPPQERSSSALLPYLDADLGPIPEIAAVSPVWVWPEIGPPERPGPPANAEPMILWRGSYDDLDEPARLGVLDAERVTTTLRGMGFVAPDGAALDITHLLGGAATGEVGVDLGHRTEAALVQVLVVDGTVRALQVDPLTADRKTWRAITTSLRALAKAEKARLIKESDVQ